MNTREEAILALKVGNMVELHGKDVTHAKVLAVEGDAILVDMRNVDDVTYNDWSFYRLNGQGADPHSSLWIAPLDMKEFHIHLGVKAAGGFQTYAVRAVSKEDALKEMATSRTEFFCEEVEVLDLDEPGLDAVEEVSD